MLPKLRSCSSKPKCKGRQESRGMMEIQASAHESIRVQLLHDPILVKPQSQSLQHNESMYLSLLDRQAPLFMYALYFYGHSKSKDDAGSVFKELKLAMEKNLVPHYPAAGRVKPNVDTGEPELHCTGEGVLLVEASTDASIADLGDLRKVNPELVKFIYQVDAVPQNPLVVCQVTRCGGGGFILGIGWRHDLFDGTSALQFLADWASLSRGVTLEDIQVPFHSREVLRPSNSKLTPTELDSLFADRFEGIPLIEIPSAGKPKQGCLPKYETKVFSVSNEMISYLKEKAMEGGHLVRCSTFDVLAAHAWLARTKATGLDPSERVLLEFTVNGRPRVASLPDSYSGNAYVMAHKNCHVAKLLSSPFHSVVKMVQDAKSTVTDTFIKDSMRMLEGMKTRALPSFRETTIISDWTRIPFHTLDFGWGTPVSATPVTMPISDVIFLLRDGLDEGNICLRLGLPSEIMDRFEKLVYQL